MRILVVGDVYGNRGSCGQPLNVRSKGNQHDLAGWHFGYWLAHKSGEKFLTDLERSAAEHNVTRATASPRF